MQIGVGMKCYMAELVSFEQSTQGVAGTLSHWSIPQIFAEPGISVERNKSIYHLLSRAFCQCVSVAEIVDFDVFDVITICNVDLAIDVARALARGGRCSVPRRTECLRTEISTAFETRCRDFTD